MHLTYELRTPRGTKQFAIDYADLMGNIKTIEERHVLYLVVGAVISGVGALLGAFIYSTENRISGFGFALFGVIFLAAYFIQRRKFVIMFAPRESIIVFSGKRQAIILNEIAVRRKARFLQLLKRADIAIDEVKRRGIIAMLQDQGVLSNDEAALLLSNQSVRLNNVSNIH